MLAMELPGTVEQVKFENGSSVQKGDVLVQLDVSSEQAQLRSAEADAELARVAVERARNLRKGDVISNRNSTLPKPPSSKKSRRWTTCRR